MMDSDTQQAQRDDLSDPAIQNRLAQLETTVWAGVAARRTHTQRVTAACAALAFIGVTAGSYSIGAAEGNRTGLHVSMADELSDGGALFDGWAG
jgi:hypothetical protein